jgi:hypothetical protein
MAETLIDELAAYCRAGDAKPFEVGRTDCSLWVADWVQQQTGIDLAAVWRGQYSSRDEYLRLLIARGGLVRVAHRALMSIRAKRIEPAAAQLGDVGVIVTTDGPALAIFGWDQWNAKTGDRLSRAPHASFAWRI